jgi:hypothetical protein
LEWRPDKRADTAIQLRFEASGGLVLMYEVSPNGEQYVIGNGKNVRFICDDKLSNLLWELEARGKK